MLRSPVALLTTLLLAAALIAPSAARAEPASQTKEREITITATGSISAAPDQAEVGIGVANDAATAKAALAANSASMRPVIEALKGAGIDAKDIATSSFNLQPVFAYSNDGKPPKLTGYRATNSVQAKVRDLGKLGDVLDLAVGQGSNQISGLTFIVSNADELKDEARKAAVANATRMAKAYAAAAGVTLGDVQSIDEAFQGGAYRPAPTFARAQAAAPAPPPIEPGEQELEVQVTIVWTIK